VVFASPFGLYLIDSGGVPSKLSQPLFASKQWAELRPEKIFAFFYKGSYLAFFSGTNVGIEFVPGEASIRRFRTDAYVWGGQYVSTVSINTYQFITSDGEEFVTSGGSDFYVSGASYPLVYDTLYLIQTKGGVREVVAFNSGGDVSYEWISKNFYLMRKHILSAGRVAGDFPDQAEYTDMSQYAVSEYYISVVLDLYIDGALHFTKILTSDKAFRVPRAMGSVFKIGLTGTVPIDRVVMGASLSEVTQHA